MLFQALDDKKHCVGVYVDGNLVYDKLPENLTKTWKYSDFLADRNIEYASLYCGSKSLTEMCPPVFLTQWKETTERLKAFLRSFHEARVDLSKNCFFDLVPEQFLKEYCEIKNKITEHTLEICSRPENYDFLLDMTKLVGKIKSQTLNVDTEELKSRLSEYKVRQFCKKIKTTNPVVDYNIFGTKTGRLTTRKNSFPILTMDSSYRKILKPKNGWFVELDYNAAELRALTGLLDKEQPTEDIHDFNATHVYHGTTTREEAKKRIFAWLYNPHSKDSASKRVYDRDKVLKKHWHNTHVTTPFGREIDSDEYHALNYIIQSTCSDIVLRQAIKLDKFLENYKTNIAFMIHDSIVLDMSPEDEHKINEIFHLFADTEFGLFQSSAKAGKNFGEMKDLWIKL